MRWVALVAVVAGCCQLYGLDDPRLVDPIAADAAFDVMADQRVDMAPPATCTEPLNLARSRGRLRVSPV